MLKSLESIRARNIAIRIGFRTNRGTSKSGTDVCFEVQLIVAEIRVACTLFINVGSAQSPGTAKAKHHPVITIFAHEIITEVDDFDASLLIIAIFTIAYFADNVNKMAFFPHFL